MFQCNTCNAGFKEKRNLQNHIEKTHPLMFDHGGEPKQNLQDLAANILLNPFAFKTPHL